MHLENQGTDEKEDGQLRHRHDKLCEHLAAKQSIFLDGGNQQAAEGSILLLLQDRCRYSIEAKEREEDGIAGKCLVKWPDLNDMACCQRLGGLISLNIGRGHCCANSDRVNALLSTMIARLTTDLIYLVDARTA